MSPTTPRNTPPAPTVPAAGRKESMSAADFRTLTARKPAGKGKTSAATPKAPTVQETAAIDGVAKVGRYVGHYESQPARRYVLRNDAEANALDAAFYQITGTQPA